MSNNGSDETTSEVSRGRPEGWFLGPLRTMGLVAVVIGAVGSAGFFLRAGQHTPRLLLLLMAIWVFSPFVALVWANVVSKRWSVLTRAALYSVIDRKSTRLNSSHIQKSRMPSSA